MPGNVCLGKARCFQYPIAIKLIFLNLHSLQILQCVDSTSKICSIGQVDGIGIQYSEKGNDKDILDLNELTSNFHASKF